MDVCKKCGGKLESKGVRRQARRYRCTACRSSAGSIPLTEEEIKCLKKRDKGIGDLSLSERYEERLGLARTKQPYSLLPKYDPKYCNKLSEDLSNR